MEFPQVAICIVTYRRVGMALRTIQSTLKNLVYPGQTAWYLADDGSPKEEFDAMLAELNGQKILGYHNERLRQEGDENTYFAGMGWNRGMGICYQNTDFVLWLEDDWELEEKFDIAPYVKLLMEREDVGVCSFRILSTGCDVHTVGHNGIHYLRYERSTQYAYSGNPHLRHARFVQHYGWCSEKSNPGDIELRQDDAYRLDVTSGPYIWRPVAIDPWGPWHHIGNEKSWQ